MYTARNANAIRMKYEWMDRYRASTVSPIPGCPYVRSREPLECGSSEHFQRGD
jgi:hypothetical protein